MVNHYNNNMRTNVHRGIQRNSSPSCGNEHQHGECNALRERLNNSSASNSGCGCESDNHNGHSHDMTLNADCKALMNKLRMIDFSIVDTVLYLDIYPECKKALAYYNKLLEERDAIRKTLAKKCKRPMSSFENASDCSWDWISSPWPWDVSAN